MSVLRLASGSRRTLRLSGQAGPVEVGAHFQGTEPAAGSEVSGNEMQTKKGSLIASGSNGLIPYIDSGKSIYMVPVIRQKVKQKRGFTPFYF